MATAYICFLTWRVCGVTARHHYLVSGNQYPLTARCVGCEKVRVINASQVELFERVITQGYTLLAEPLEGVPEPRSANRHMAVVSGITS